MSSPREIIPEMNSAPRIYYAVYSQEQEYNNKNIKTGYNGKEYVRQNRYNIYEMEDGTQVKTTEVSKNPNLPADHKRRFPDSVYLGNVVKWVKSVNW